MGNARRVGREAGAKDRHIGQAPSLPICGETARQLGLAAPIVSERQEVHHGPAGLPLGQRIPEGIEGEPVGLAREELIPVDEVQERHGLAAE